MDGDGAAWLGLTGEEGEEDLARLLEGRDPSSGLLLRPLRSSSPVAAFDLTLRAPKSVSILFGVAQPAIAQRIVASEVAVAFKVTRGWVYAHADELGAIRLGDGPRPRLRFDPAVVAQRLQARRRRITASSPSDRMAAFVPLLPIGPARSRRTLETQ